MLQHRAKKLGYEVETTLISLEEDFNPEDFDIVMFGGGQDYEQSIVAKDLPSKRDAIGQFIQDNKVILAICGGFQLLGQYYIQANGVRIDGIGVMGHYTLNQENNRYIGDIKIHNEEFDETYYGFENHQGRTFLSDDEKPLYVGVDNVMRINGYYDTPQADSHFISAGIYGLTAPSLDILEACIEKGESRMRNFQRALVAAGLRIEAYPLTKVFDIDHIDDIRKADEGVNNLSSCCKGKTLLIQRAACYSPNSEEKDLAVLQEVSSASTTEAPIYFVNIFISCLIVLK